MTMRPVSTQVAWSVRLPVCLSVFDTLESSGKKVQQIEVEFGMSTRVAQGTMWAY